MGEGPVQQTIECIQRGIEFKKCWMCGCQQETGIEIERALPIFKEEDRAQYESQAWFLRGLCRLGCQMVGEGRKDLLEALKLDPSLKESIDDAFVPGLITLYSATAQKKEP